MNLSFKEFLLQENINIIRSAPVKSVPPGNSRESIEYVPINLLHKYGETNTLVVNDISIDYGSKEKLYTCACI